MTNITQYIEENTLRLEADRRGGGIEVDASEYTGIEGAKMTAYQNYLGGGILGSIQSDRNFTEESEKADELEDALKRYYYNITNELAADYDEYGATDSYDEQQHRPESAY